jgi:putative replication initiation protein
LKTNKSYFSHDSNARNSDKLLKVRMDLGAEGYAIYFMILERLREEDDYISKNDYMMIAYDLRVDEEKVKKVINDYDLFIVDDDVFYSKSFMERMTIKDSKRLKAQKAVNERWEKEKKKKEQEKYERNTDVLQTYNERNTNLYKEKKSKEKKSKDNIYTASADAHAELKSETQGRIWAAYPVKKGKIHAMKSIEKLLKGYTEQQVLNAIATYKADVEKQKASGFKELRYKQGDTFFRTGIYDYLDLEGGETIESNRLGQANEGTSGKADKWSNYDFGDKDL